MFITKYDFKASIKSHNLKVITENDAQKRIRAENTAISEVYSYLSARYDMPLVFIDIPAFSTTKAYVTGDYIVYVAESFNASNTYDINVLVEDSTNGKLYKSLIAANNDPLTNTTSWELFKYIPIFKAIADGTGNLPTDSNFFTLEDPRHDKTVMIIIDIAIYDLHKAVSPDEIPGNRIDARDNAVEWLKMVQKQMLNPDLPEPADQSKEEILYGSRTKSNLHY